MDKPVLTVVSGFPASGKSTFSKELSERTDAVIFSSDALREEMYGDVNDQAHNAKVFRELHKRIKECLKSGNDAIYDATNIKSKTRTGFLRELSKIDCYKRCVIMATPIEQCIENNRNRKRKVPESVITRMYLQWNTPYYFEGFDEISVVYWEGSKESLRIHDWVADHIEYDQSNPHHSKTLGMHCLDVGKQLADNACDLSLVQAGYLHDIGKPFCRTFIDSRGNRKDYASYYSHENAGAYDSLFFSCSNPLETSVLVGLHMRPYVWERDDNEKLKNKYRKLWGEKLYKRVIMLHEADKAAH